VVAVAGTFDERAVLELAADRSPGLTTLAHGASVLGRSAIIVPLVLVSALVVATRRERVLRAWAPVVSVAGALVLYNVDKLLVARPRPVGHRLEMISSASFPSGHATQVTAFYVSLLLACWPLISRRVVRVTLAAVAMLLVAAIAASRVYLGVHYPSDVAAGAVLGGVWAATVWALLVRPLLASGSS